MPVRIRELAHGLDESHPLDPELEALAGRALGAVRAVYREMGPGLPEGIYHHALALEFEDQCIPYESEPRVVARYKGRPLAQPIRPDFLVGGKLVMELKSVEELHPVHHLQLTAYLKVTGCKLGFLVNFNVPHLSAGIKRKIWTV